MSRIANARGRDSPAQTLQTSGHMPLHTTASSAFSLIEIMIIVVILAIAAAMAVPQFDGISNNRLKAAAELVAADIAFAKIDTIAHGDAPRAVVFDTTNNKYSVTLASDTTTPITNQIGGITYETTFGTGRASQLPGVTIQSVSLDGDDNIVFGVFGNLDQTTNATITLEASGETMTITVDPISGDTSISSP